MSGEDLLASFEALEKELLTAMEQLRVVRGAFERIIAQQQRLEPLLDADQVAKILGVDVAYVYSQARCGKIPSVKLGKYRRFSPLQLRKWLDRKV